MTEAKKLNDKLDNLYRDYIRMRAIIRVHGCERCLHWKGTYKLLQCSHFWGRRIFNTRWDEDNGVGLCPACHMYLTSHPALHAAWYEEHLGQPAFDMLAARARQTGKVDKNALVIYYRGKIQELEG